MAKKLSRRDFARTSVAAGAAVVGLPGALAGGDSVAAATAMSSTAARGMAVAKRVRAALPSPVYGYGGDLVSEARDSISMAYAQSGAQAPSAPEIINGYRTGRYAVSEGATRFMQSYMKEVVSTGTTG